MKSTPDRASLYAVQTPQVFDFDILRGALAKANADNAKLTDDCSAVERIGFSVKIVDCLLYTSRCVYETGLAPSSSWT